MFKEKELGVTYENNDGEILNCYMRQADERVTDDRTPDATADYDGVTVNYYQETYKFVPEDYEKTAQDKAMEAE